MLIYCKDLTLHDIIFILNQQRLLMTTYFFLAIFLISGIIHLYASYTRNVRLRAITKPFIVSSLLIYYVCKANPVTFTMCLALFFSWLGDVLLIPNKLKIFISGAISFMISHIFFVLSFTPYINLSVIPIWLIIVIPMIYIFAALVIVHYMVPYIHKPLHIPMTGYLIINALNNCAAFYMLMSKPCIATAVVFFGTTFFFISDSILYHVRFKTTTRWKSHFPVMLTYILAEFFITQGMLML